MGRTNASMFAFNRGEVSKAALTRVDNERLRLAAECQLNWLPTVIGAMSLRSGLQMINEVRNDAANVMVPFVFSKLDTALIELTANTMRVEVADKLVTRVAVGTLVSDPNFNGGGSWATAGSTAGAAVTIGLGRVFLTCPAVGGVAQLQQQIPVNGGDNNTEHALRFTIANGPVTVRAGHAAGLADYIAPTVLDTGTHSIAFTPSTNVWLQIESYDAWTKKITNVSIDAAGILELPTPWGAGDLASIRTEQSGDIVYVAAYGLQQYKIERRGAHSWSVVLYRPDDGPFDTFADSSVTMTPAAYFGNTTLTASRAYFQAGHVGALFRLFSPGQINYVTLAGSNTFSRPVRVAGVGSTARDYFWNISGTFTGTATLQRSFDGPNSGYTDVGNTTVIAPVHSQTGGTGGTPDLDNVIAWERFGFKPGDYVSGSILASSGFTGGGGYGLCRVTSWDSPTQVEIEILRPFTSLSGTTNWVESDWSAYRGYPNSVGLFEGRLSWSGRDKLWMSQPDDYTGYAQQDTDGNDLGDAAAIIETFGAGPVDSVNWLLPLTRLLAGREESIESIRSSSFDEVVTPSNVSTKACSTQGAARLKALKIDKQGVFVQESGRRIYELVFNAQAMDYSARDLTRLNADIGKPGFVDAAVQRQPDTMCWWPKTDGQAAALLYDFEDGIEGFWRVQTLGAIENVCVLPAPSGIENFVYFTVRRTINGVTRRFREKLAARDNCIGGTINQLFDCHMVYQGPAVSTVTVPWLPSTLVGVWADGAYLGTTTSDGSGNVAMPDGQAHANIVVGLLGQVYQGSAAAPAYALISSVAIPAIYNGFPAEVFADGRRIGPLVITGGAVTLPQGRTAASITAFVGYMAPFMSAKLAYAAQGGTAINQHKRVDHVGLLLQDTAFDGLLLGQRMDTLDPMPAIENGGAVPAGTVYDQYDEQMQEVPGEWNTDARLCMLAAAPKPVTVNGVVISITTNG
jgi:hypothetical protein